MQISYDQAQRANNQNTTNPISAADYAYNVRPIPQTQDADSRNNHTHGVREFFSRCKKTWPAKRAIRVPTALEPKVLRGWNEKRIPKQDEVRQARITNLRVRTRA